MLAGRDGLGDGGWGRVTIAPLLPAKLPGGSGRSYGMRKSQARLTAYGRESVVGRLAADGPANEKAWQELPALTDYQEPGRAASRRHRVARSRERPAGFAAAGHAALRPRFHLAAGHGHHLALADAAAEGRPSATKSSGKQLLYTLASPSQPPVSLQPERSVYEGRHRRDAGSRSAGREIPAGLRAHAHRHGQCAQRRRGAGAGRAFGPRRWGATPWH